MARRRMLVTGAAAAALALPGAAVAATPQWHPATYPSAPSGGAQPVAGAPLTLAVGPSGKANLLYRGTQSALWTFSRASAQAAWGSGVQWQSKASIGATGEVSAALGSKLTALWTTSAGGLSTSTGSQTSGGKLGQMGAGPTTASPQVAIAPSGVAYSFAEGSTTSGGLGFGGRTQATAPLDLVAQIGSTDGQLEVQTGVDSQGDMTAAWVGPTGQIQVATKPADVLAWSAPTTLPGSAGGAYTLAVAPNGGAVIVYQGNVAQAFATSTGLNGQPVTTQYLAQAQVLVVQRPAGAAAFGPPQVLGTFTQAPPAAGQFPAIGFTFPTETTAAINNSTVVVGYVSTTPADDPVTYQVARAAVGAALPPTTRLTDPLVQGQGDTTSWTLTGAAMAIDKNGNAAFVAGGSTTQGQPDSAFASTSTNGSPKWKAMKDVAGCASSAVDGDEGLDRGPTVVASPAGGLVAAWQCNKDSSGSTVTRSIGLAAFDTYGPPVVAFSASGKTAKFTLGEPATYLLTATKGSAKRTASGKASAGKQVSRTLDLSSGTWKVTLKATLSSGNSTTTSRNTTVSG